MNFLFARIRLHLILSNKISLQKILAEGELAQYVAKQKVNLQDLTEVPEDLQRRWNLLVKPGDYLLPEENWNMVKHSNCHISSPPTSSFIVDCSLCKRK